MLKKITPYALHISLVLATLGLFGSLYFSLVMEYAPCVLCWYQRVALYPLVPILIVGILREDRHVWQYVLPLTIFGWGVSLYHNLLYMGIISEKLQTCQVGVSCTTKYIEWFGFVTIPLLSLIAFTVIGGLVWMYKK